MKLAQSSFALLALLWFAPVSATNAFPDGSVPITKDDLQQRLSGKAFTVRLADGTHWDIAFTSTGGLSVETSKGFKGSGDWKADEGKLCSHMRGQDFRCGEARLFENFLYVKRADGEVIKYVPK